MMEEIAELNLLRQRLESLKPTLKIYRDVERSSDDEREKKVTRRQREIYVPEALRMSRRVRELSTITQGYRDQQLKSREERYRDYLKQKGITLDG